MKMLDVSIPFSLVALIAACLCAGCSESAKVTGTAEETNEFALDDSSSSGEPSSSSSNSSSNQKPVSSGSSSSAGDVASSTSQNGSGVGSSAEESSSSMASEVSSSSLEPVSSGNVEESSSSAPPPQGGINSSNSTVGPNSLEYYVGKLGLNINQVYAGVVAASSTEEKDSDTDPGEAMATEFDGPWPHRFVKQNIAALEYFFPDAADEYAGLVDSIKAGLTEGDCGLYMMNVYGDDRSVGYVIADIAADKVVVLDVAVGECPNSAVNRTFRFLFRHCGEIDSRPEIEHVEVSSGIPLDQCPDFEDEMEWVN